MWRMTKIKSYFLGNSDYLNKAWSNSVTRVIFHIGVILKLGSLIPHYPYHLMAYEADKYATLRMRNLELKNPGNQDSDSRKGPALSTAWKPLPSNPFSKASGCYLQIKGWWSITLRSLYGHLRNNLASQSLGTGAWSSREMHASLFCWGLRPCWWVW